MPDEDTDKVNDREPVYNRITVYDNFEEQEDAHRKHMASLSPEERIRQAVLLIKKVYNYKGPVALNQMRIRIKKKQ